MKQKHNRLFYISHIPIELNIKKQSTITVPTKVFGTGQKPILVMCDDGNDYVVKYKRSNSAKLLFFEYLAGCFLKIWKLEVPDFAFIEVKKEHIPAGFYNDIQPHYFDIPCFGSLYNSAYNDVNSFLFTASSYDKSKFLHKFDLLFIALFDLWLSNEDRNFNNHNLLFDLDNGNKFIPIDHQNIFNYDNLPDLTILTENESLLYSPITKGLFNKNIFKNGTYLNELNVNFISSVNTCKKELNTILSNTPDSWNIDRADWEAMLDKTIFSEAWIAQTWKSFCSYLHETLN